MLGVKEEELGKLWAALQAVQEPEFAYDRQYVYDTLVRRTGGGGGGGRREGAGRRGGEEEGGGGRTGGRGGGEGRGRGWRGDPRGRGLQRSFLCHFPSPRPLVPSQIKMNNGNLLPGMTPAAPPQPAAAAPAAPPAGAGIPSSFRGPPAALSHVGSYRGHAGMVLCMTYDSQGSHLITAANDGTVLAWNADGSVAGR
jgi:hypothetical protein